MIKEKIKKINKITNIKKIRIIDNIRFWINLLTSVLFIYLAYDLNRPISMGIGWLLLIGWALGAYERRLLMKRRIDEKHYTHIKFQLAYSKNPPTMLVEVLDRNIVDYKGVKSYAF